MSAAADGVINHQGWYYNYGRTVKIQDLIELGREELFERGGFDHGDTMYEEATHVPLILRAPGRVPAPLRIHATGLPSTASTDLVESPAGEQAAERL